MLKSSHRHTIMSGRVVTYAQDFKAEPGIFGERYEPLGAFEVSASRDAVMVHRAEIASPLCLTELQAALTEAWAEHNRLKRCDGRPRLDEADRGAPRDVTYNAQVNARAGFMARRVEPVVMQQRTDLDE